ncbi:hypothetical protein [Falsirhodobacter deserti]|uniref:hypothetical protein n=1 Tax=Falsirhodobacter deserti TaxID=1365611 RepID=UPI000FE42C07|nr:hypothetical protein [Falsirhodobacter deserti]
MGSVAKTKIIDTANARVSIEPRSIFNASYGSPDSGPPHRHGKVKAVAEAPARKDPQNKSEKMWGDLLR